MFSKVYAWIAAGIAGLGVFLAIYLKGRGDAKQADAARNNRRLRDAIEADVRGRERIARGELLNDDGHKRD